MGPKFKKWMVTCGREGKGVKAKVEYKGRRTESLLHGETLFMRVFSYTDLGFMFVIVENIISYYQRRNVKSWTLPTELSWPSTLPYLTLLGILVMKPLKSSLISDLTLNAVSFASCLTCSLGTIFCMPNYWSSAVWLTLNYLEKQRKQFLAE